MYWLPRKKVLVPTDFSDASLDAMHTALSMVEYAHCVHVLHIVQPIPDDLAAGTLAQDAGPAESEEARRQVHLERLESFLTAGEVDGLIAVVQTGDPALCITQYARDNDIDLVVMAAHGYDRGERISMGSVTERVLHNADGPVLVLRPDRRASGERPRAGVRESSGFSPAETPSHIVTAARLR